MPNVLCDVHVINKYTLFDLQNSMRTVTLNSKFGLILSIKGLSKQQVWITIIQLLNHVRFHYNVITIHCSKLYTMLPVANIHYSAFLYPKTPL